MAEQAPRAERESISYAIRRKGMKFDAFLMLAPYRHIGYAIEHDESKYMTIKQLKTAIDGLPDDASVDVIALMPEDGGMKSYDGETLSLVIDKIEPSDFNNTVAFFCSYPE